MLINLEEKLTLGFADNVFTSDHIRNPLDKMKLNCPDRPTWSCPLLLIDGLMSGATCRGAPVLK